MSGLYNPFNRGSTPSAIPGDPLGIGRAIAGALGQAQARKKAEEQERVRQGWMENMGAVPTALQAPRVGPAPAIPMDGRSAAASFVPQSAVNRGGNVDAQGRPVSTESGRNMQQFLTNPLSDMFAITRRSESGDREYNADGSRVTSPKGARGIMQVMPATARKPGYGIRPSDGTPQDDARVGEEYLQKMMDLYGNDPKKAWAAYNAGPGAVNARLEKHGDNWLNYMPAETKTYVGKNVTALAGPDAAAGMPQFDNAFDRSAYDGQLGEINKANVYANTPSQITTAAPVAPEMPDLPVAPTRDFTAQDAALARLKPQELDQVKEARIKRANLFQGLASGLARIPDGAGLGMVLAQIGAGMLAGRAAGDSEVIARQDAFDEKMAQYNIALFQNEKEKGTQLFAEASQEYNMTYQHNMKKFDTQMTLYGRNNPPLRVEGNNVIQTREDGKGNLVTDIMPLTNANNAAAAMARAAVMGRIGDGENQGAMAGAQFANQIMANQFLQNAAATAQASGVGQVENLANSAGVMGFTIASSGLLEQVVGDAEQYASILEGAKRKAMEMGVNPGSAEYGETVTSLLGTFATQALMTDEGFRKRAGSFAPIVTQVDANRRYQDATRTTKTKVGNTTTTVRE